MDALKPEETLTVDKLPKLLENDSKVKVAGIDVDGVLRGKLMSKKKFLSIAEEGFGFCSVILDLAHVFSRLVLTQMTGDIWMGYARSDLFQGAQDQQQRQRIPGHHRGTGSCQL